MKGSYPQKCKLKISDLPAAEDQPLFVHRCNDVAFATYFQAMCTKWDWWLCLWAVCFGTKDRESGSFNRKREILVLGTEPFWSSKTRSEQLQTCTKGSDLETLRIEGCFSFCQSSSVILKLVLFCSGLKAIFHNTLIALLTTFSGTSQDIFPIGKMLIHQNRNSSWGKKNQFLWTSQLKNKTKQEEKISVVGPICFENDYGVWKFS